MRGITLFPPEKGFPRVTAPTKLISVCLSGLLFHYSIKRDIIEMIYNKRDKDKKGRRFL